MILMLFTW